MNNKTIWLDLELRKDIDDYMTLIYALDKTIIFRKYQSTILQ